jgi:glycosyltransferase involved in cell wall biosynthesis
VSDPAAPELLIHATNVTGLGAARVVEALLPPLCERLQQRAVVFVPETGSLSTFSPAGGRVSAAVLRRRLPNAVSRAAECLLPSLYFPDTARTLVLGDLPLRGRGNQVVFVQQAHLVSPSVNEYVGSSATFRLSRRLFARQLPFVSTIVVQSAPMKEALEQSYPAARGRVVVIPHPLPGALEAVRHTTRAGGGPLRLFYPAAGHPHKNHRILQQMASSCPANAVGEVIVTLTPAEEKQLGAIPWVRNAGRVPVEICRRYYGEVDAVFFPSLLESFGLPLIEAMTAGLPIVCADLPYARWMCGEQAIYFQPDEAASACRAIGQLQEKLATSWQPDWSQALAKFPASWDEVATKFLECLQQR